MRLRHASILVASWLIVISLFLGAVVPAATAQTIRLFSKLAYPELAAQHRAAAIWDIDRAALAEAKSLDHFTLEAFPILDSAVFDLDLTAFSVLPDQSPVEMVTPSGVVSGPRPSVKMFRGTVHGAAHSFVYLAIAANGLSGRISIEGKGYEIGTQGERSVVTETFGREVFDRAVAQNRLEQETTANGGIPSAGPECSLSIDCDHETLARFGDAQTLVDYVVERAGAVSVIYQSTTGSPIMLAGLRIFTNEEPYSGTSLGMLLYNFSKNWSAENTTPVPFGSAILLSSKTFGKPHEQNSIGNIGSSPNPSFGFAAHQITGRTQLPACDEDMIALQLMMLQVPPITPATTESTLPTVPTPHFEIAATPNPFRNSQEIVLTYDAALNGHSAKVAVYDDLGRELTVVFDGILQNNKAELHWSSLNLPAGAYHLIATSGNLVRETSVTLVK